MGELQHICYLCFSSNTSIIGRNIDFDTDIYACNACGLIQTNVVSSPYLGYYYHKKYREVRNESITEKYLNFLSLRAASQHKFIRNNLPEPAQVRTVLDIGASAGKLLESFIPAAKAFAVEADATMIEYINNIRSITVIDEAALFEEENHRKFDLITLSHVFEHINNPLAYLYNLHKIVSDEGYVFLEVPNEPVHLVSHNINKRKRGIGHLFDYTVDTLRQMIDKSALFKVISLATYSVSVADYLKGAAISNFEENKLGDGRHIRCLLKKLDSGKSHAEYRYIDSVLQNLYRRQLTNEKRKQCDPG